MDKHMTDRVNMKVRVETALDSDATYHAVATIDLPQGPTKSAQRSADTRNDAIGAALVGLGRLVHARVLTPTLDDVLDCATALALGFAAGDKDLAFDSTQYTLNVLQTALLVCKAYPESALHLERLLTAQRDAADAVATAATELVVDEPCVTSPRNPTAGEPPAPEPESIPTELGGDIDRPAFDKALATIREPNPGERAHKTFEEHLAPMAVEGYGTFEFEYEVDGRVIAALVDEAQPTMLVVEATQDEAIAKLKALIDAVRADSAKHGEQSAP